MSKIFVMSDAHFNHKNIIKYCHRPFDSTEQMNKAIVANWNRVVASEDTIYFLGDWGTGDAQQWIRQLKGHIVLIKGQHDREHGCNHIVLNINGTHLLLTHNPSDIKFDGWIIHGHKHNNDLIKHPFLHPVNRTINVSAEMVSYTPVNITEIMQRIKSTEVTPSKSRDFFSKQPNARSITRHCIRTKKVMSRPNLTSSLGDMR